MYLLPRKSSPQWKVYRRYVIPEFFYSFKPFSITKFTTQPNSFIGFLSLKQFYVIFIMKKIAFYNVVPTSHRVIYNISSSLRLFLKVWIWYIYKDKIKKHYPHDRENFLTDSFRGFWLNEHLPMATSPSYTKCWKSTCRVVISYAGWYPAICTGNKQSPRGDL